MGKSLAWLVVGVVALVILATVVANIVGALLKLAFVLLLGIAVVGGGLYLLGRARGTNRRRGRYRELR